MLASARVLRNKARLVVDYRFSPTYARRSILEVRSFLRVASRLCHTRPLILIAFASVVICLATIDGFPQNTNPVDRKVTNPMTDTPNVNPLTQDQPIPARTPAKKGEAPQVTDRLTVDAQKSTEIGKEKGERIVVHEGNVDARIGTYRLQADKVTVYEATNRVVAEGNVVFDQGEQQRITGSRAEWNYKTKTGFFINSTGFTNQTQDGTRLYFTADRVERVSLDTIIAENAQITACDENVPKWSFHAKRVKIKTGDRARLVSTSFRIKGLPVIYLPYASISIKHRDRASGFLTPTFGGSGAKGFRVSEGYYLTLGRSADITFRGDVYTQRGLGFGTDLRTRANSRSFFNAGFFYVKDRILGPHADAAHPDQGGSSFYVEGVHYFPNGFTAAADVNVTSNLAYRQVFSDSIQQAISPEERSQVFVNKDHKDYSFNFLARAQVTSLPNTRIRIREMPSVTIDKRPSPLSFFKKLPVYFSFEGGAEGVSRKETTDDLIAFRRDVGRDPMISPSMVQRLDFHPRVEVPFSFSGWNLTGSAAGRVTFYSDSVDPTLQMVTNRNLMRSYGEFEVDLRPPSLARNYHRNNGSFFFRHLIEPYLIYRRIVGVNDFDRVIRFDYVEAVADTNEIEFGLANRFFTRRSTENVSAAAKKKAAQDGAKGSKATQPYEALTITVRGKYFFDRFFGGALKPGQRNQFYPIDTLSGFSYGGVPRRFSPLNIDARYRPRADVFLDFRTDLDTHGGSMRAMSATFGVNRSLVQAFQTFYYTRAIALVPNLAQYADARGKEAGTLRGSQWSPSIFIGDRAKGLYGGASFFFDFQDRPGKGNTSLISSTVTLGYSWDCCAVTAQNSTFNVGLRKENRLLFSFRLNGIGSFGTEQIGQRFR
ncbi:MAG: Organic solvent tolerance protein OstA [Acidobacteria bacterium]|nr:Organic solvent tolerance protein OstA [Acidobacteriota bacterium]